MAFRDIDAADSRMRQGAAHESDVLQSGEPDIGDELAAPAHQAIVLLAHQPRADALPRSRGDRIARARRRHFALLKG
jgi:hypothetical protein